MEGEREEGWRKRGRRKKGVRWSGRGGGDEFKFSLINKLTRETFSRLNTPSLIDQKQQMFPVGLFFLSLFFPVLAKQNFVHMN